MWLGKFKTLRNKVIDEIISGYRNNSFVKDIYSLHPRMLSAMFGWNFSSGFRKKTLKIVFFRLDYYPFLYKDMSLYQNWLKCPCGSVQYLSKPVHVLVFLICSIYVFTHQRISQYYTNSQKINFDSFGTYSDTLFPRQLAEVSQFTQRRTVKATFECKRA